MAQPVYSTRFICDNSTWHYAYTCPAGFVALITCIDVHIGSTVAGGNWIVDMLGGVVVGSTVYLPIAPVNLTFRGKLVLNPGDSIALYTDAEDTYACTVNGDLLTQ